MASINDIGTPGAWLNDPPLTEWQAAVRDKLNAHDVGDVWQVYIPTATNFTIQSSIMYYRLTPGGMVTIAGQVTIQTMGTSPSLSLPPGMTSPVLVPVPFLISQAGVTIHPGVAYLGAGIDMYVLPTTAGGGVRPISAVTPFAWKAGDILHVSATYPRA